MIDQPAAPPTLAQHQLVLRLRRLRDFDSGLYELSEAQAARAIAASEAAAVAAALAEAEKEKRDLRWLIRELVDTKGLTRAVAGKLELALK